jgi:multiple sugar transport system permease protein
MNKNQSSEAARMQLRLTRTVCYIVLILLSAMCLFSFYVLIINSTRSHPDIQKGFSFLPGGSFGYNLKNLLANENLPVVKAIFNSLLISTCAALVTTYFSALTAYAIHAYDFRFKRAAFTFIMMIMMIPSQVTALGFVRLMGTFNLLDTFIPLIIPTAASPIVFFFMKQYMEATLPLAIVEAARIDGSSEFHTFNHIVLPIMTPAIAVQGIFSFVTSWNNYFVPSLILKSTDNKTVPLLVAQLRNADFLKFDMGQVYMLVTIAIVPVIIVYLLLSKYIIRGITLGSVKG